MADPFTKRPLPTRLAILPSTEYVFNRKTTPKSLSFEVVAEWTLGNGIAVAAINNGLLAYDFSESSLGEFTVLRETAEGLIPEEVMANREALMGLQSRRLQFAMFIVACVYGKHAIATHSALRGLLHPGLHEIYGWDRDPTRPALRIHPSEASRLEPNLMTRAAMVRSGKAFACSIPPERFHEGMQLADRLLSENHGNAVADYVALLEMYYQAAVLHSVQHSGASIALSSAVLEVALEELFFVYGIVPGSTPRDYAREPHSVPVISSKHPAAKLRLKGMIEYLASGGLLGTYLAQRLHEVRTIRNNIMHRGMEPLPSDAGKALTVVRDVLGLCTGEEFELSTAFTYRF